MFFLPGKLQTQKLRSLLAENPELSKDFFCKSGAGQNIASCDSLATKNFAFLLRAYLHSYYLPVCIRITCLSAFVLSACPQSYYLPVCIRIICLSAVLLPACLHSYYLPVCSLITCLSAFVLPACLHSYYLAVCIFITCLSKHKVTSIITADQTTTPDLIKFMNYVLTLNWLHNRFKRTLIYYYTDTQSENFQGNPLRQATKRLLNDS